MFTFANDLNIIRSSVPVFVEHFPDGNLCVFFKVSPKVQRAVPLYHGVDSELEAYVIPEKNDGGGGVSVLRIIDPQPETVLQKFSGADPFFEEERFDLVVGEVDPPKGVQKLL